MNGEEETDRVPADTESEAVKTEYLMAGTVATMFEVTTYTVRTWIRQGKFPNAVKRDGYWRIPRSDVNSLMQSKYGSDKPAIGL